MALCCTVSSSWYHFHSVMSQMISYSTFFCQNKPVFCWLRASDGENDSLSHCGLSTRLNPVFFLHIKMDALRLYFMWKWGKQFLWSRTGVLLIVGVWAVLLFLHGNGSTDFTRINDLPSAYCICSHCTKLCRMGVFHISIQINGS